MSGTEHQTRYYAAIDLKSFYASVECVDRGLDPLKTNLVVADRSRTDKTICLAVSPALKAHGIPGRARLFEVAQAMENVNCDRLRSIKSHRFSGKSCNADKLRSEPELEAGFLTAVPRMSRYMQMSAEIIKIYQELISPEDIHVYSIDEVFIDLTPYLKPLKTTPKQLVSRLIMSVFRRTGITATAGIGTNLYLCKVAMDILAKHAEPDENGVRIAELNERSYREQLWTHKPLGDFWRVGKGYVRKLEKLGITTMGDVARISIENEDIFYDMFGVNAELLIDHAWGWESCTIADIHNHKPDSSSLGSGQVLKRPYSRDEARLIVREMAEAITLELVERKMSANRIDLMVIYDRDNDPNEREMVLHWFGRPMPKQSHGNIKLDRFTHSTKEIIKNAVELYDKITVQNLTVRRLFITLGNTTEDSALAEDAAEQISMFDLLEPKAPEHSADDRKEEKQQKAISELRNRFGRNSIIRGSSLKGISTAIERNESIGGHKA